MAETQLARFIRRRLAVNGTSIVAMSEETGLDRPHIYKIFKAKRPENKTLRKIAHAINVDINVLIDLVEDQNKN